MKIAEKIHKLLIEFAKKNKKTQAIYKYKLKDTYYFVRDRIRFDEDYTNKLTDFVVLLSEKYGLEVDLIAWPNWGEGSNKALGECIYKKNS